MTAKKFPCIECGAVGRDPHIATCTIGIARGNAARKNQANRRKVTSGRRKCRTQTISKPSAKTAVVEAVQVNRIAICVDRSTSMGRIFRPAIRALNDQIAAIKTQAAKTGQPTYVSVYDFGSDVRCLFRDQYVHAISEITDRDISLAGMTAMMDCVGQAVEDLERLPDADDDNVSFLIMTITDGMENRSRRYSSGAFVRFIERLTGTDRWTFVFSGPRDSRHYLERLGVHSGNIPGWDQTEAGVADMSFNVNVGTQSYFTARAAGKRSTKEFFQVDMSQVDDHDIRSMSNQSSSFRTLKVDNAAPGGVEWQIRDFVEDRMKRNATFRRQAGDSYGIGLAYYQLTKTEKVQPAKDILVRDKTTGAIYGGHEARAIIGMPVNVDVRVKPGNHGNYDIFIKSTSVNRKLVRGTDVLYRIR